MILSNKKAQETLVLVAFVYKLYFPLHYAPNFSGRVALRYILQDPIMSFRSARSKGNSISDVISNFLLLCCTSIGLIENRFALKFPVLTCFWCWSQPNLLNSLVVHQAQFNDTHLCIFYFTFHFQKLTVYLQFREMVVMFMFFTWGDYAFFWPTSLQHKERLL